jgi:hypothetical protein
LYSNTWAIELADGPVPTTVQICPSFFEFPSDLVGPNGYMAGYINYYEYSDPAHQAPMAVYLYDPNSPVGTYATMAMHPAMTSVCFTVFGGDQVGANVNVTTDPDLTVPIYP